MSAGVRVLALLSRGTLIPVPGELCSRCQARPRVVGTYCAGCDELIGCVRADLNDMEGVDSD